MDIERLHREIDSQWPKHLRETRRLLRIPSVSMTGEGIQESAEEFAEVLRGLGAKTRLFKASPKSHPLVAGYLDVGADTTGLVYGMYDVQPVGDLDEWDHPPFAATIVRKKPYGEVLINRGAYNSKASLVGQLMAFKVMADMGELPMNLHFMIEGEEELGGFSLPKYVDKNKATLSKAEVAWAFDYGENAEGVPIISLGTKGCIYFDLMCEGGPHGGPTQGEIHSSDAVIVQSPVFRLVQALATLVDDEQRPAVDGMWDDVAPPTEDDLRLVRKLAGKVHMDGFAREVGVQRFKFDESDEDLIKRYLFEPSLNIDGIVAGYTGEGTKTVLPDRAMVKVDIRAVANMTIEGTRQKVMAHLRRRGFSEITMRNYVDYPWSKVSPHEKVSRASIEAMRYHGKDAQVWPTAAGSAPMHLFDQVLGIPWGGTGLGHGGRAHAPNEFVVVKGMKDYEKSVVTTLAKYSELQ